MGCIEMHGAVPERPVFSGGYHVHTTSGWWMAGAAAANQGGRECDGGGGGCHARPKALPVKQYGSPPRISPPCPLPRCESSWGVHEDRQGPVCVPATLGSSSLNPARRGLDWGAAYPFPHVTLPACRYDPDNWFTLSLPQSGPVRCVP